MLPALFESFRVFKILLLQTLVRPQAVNAKIPEQHNANGNQFSYVVAHRFAKIAHQQRVEAHHNKIVNQQANKVY